MDKKLKLLKSYLDSRVKSYEKLTGLPLGDGVLEMRMLVNSDPGLIRLFVGPGTPDEGRARIIDVWYNGSFFAEKAIVGWNRFEKYQEEFTTTILDAYSDQFPVDVPLKLEIEGPIFIDLDLQRSAEYRVFMTLESGNRFYLDEAEIFAQDRSGKIFTTTDPNTGVGIANFVAVTNTTNFKMKARFKLGDFTTLTAELPVQLLLEGTTSNEAYTVFVQGPDSVKFGETANYRAKLQTVYQDDSEPTTVEDVTSLVAWSKNTDGNISATGAFTPARPEPISLVSTISAVLTKSFGNGTTFNIQGSLDVTVLRMAVSSVLVDGPSRVKENKTADYTAKVVFMNGEINSNYSPINWSILETSLGHINSGGTFSAPMVAADTAQSIIADIVFEGENHRGEKEIVVVDVAAPILTISGPDTIYDTETAKFASQITFEDRTFDITTEMWGLEDISHGSINSLAEFRPNKNVANTNVLIKASINHQGYFVTATKPLLVYASDLRPISLSITGASQLVEGNSSNYIAIAIMSDNSSRDVTADALWSVDDNNHAISARGNLTAGQVNFDVTVSITATYALHGVQQVAILPVKIVDDPIIWTPQSLSITGPNELNEEDSASYVATLTLKSNKGDTKTQEANVEWRTQAHSTIDNFGNFVALPVSATTSTIITAIYNDGLGLPLTESKNVVIKDVALLVSLQLQVQQSSLFGGFGTPFSAKLLKKTGGEIDVTADAKISYITNPPNIITVDKTNKLVTAKVMSETTSVQLTASYTEAGETLVAIATIEVRAQEEHTLVIDPNSIEVFSGEEQQLTATLSLFGGQNSLVQPIYSCDQSIGSVDTDGLFVSESSLAEDATGIISASFESEDTGYQQVFSNNVLVTVKAVVPTLLEIFTDNGILVVNEGSSIYLSSKLTYTDEKTKINDSAIVYSIRDEDKEFASIILDATTNVLQVFGKDVFADKIIPITATYVEGAKTITATTLVTIKYQRQVVELVLSLEPGPYFNSRDYELVLREKYDDGSTGSENVASNLDIVWDYDSALLSIANNVATIAGTITGTFSIFASKNSVVSNTVTGSTATNIPVSIVVYSTEGNSLIRDQQTILSASMILSDGTITSPNSTWPITWTVENEDFGTLLVENDYTALFTVISALTNGSVKVTASCFDVTTDITLSIAGFAVPTGVTISGPNTVVSGKTANYSLTVNFSDNTTKTINSTSVDDTADFEILFDDPQFVEAGTISNRGVFLAPKHNLSTSLSGEIRAAYFDSNLQEYFEAVPFVVSIGAAPAIVAVSAQINGATEMNAGQTQEFSLVVTMSEGPSVVINFGSAKTAIWSATKGTLINGRYTSESIAEGYPETITASYENVSATKEIVVRPTIATAIIATPSAISIFEGQAQSIVVKTNTGVEVKPVWSLSNGLAGAMDSLTGIFSAAQVSSNIATTLVAKYGGPETNGSEFTVNVGVTVKDLTASMLTIVPISGTASVDEEGTATFGTAVKLTDNSVSNVIENVEYSVTVGQQYVSLAATAGILTVTGLNVTSNQTVTLKATYTHPDGKVISNTLPISVKNTIKRLADIVVDINPTRPFYYENETVELRVREKYDDNTFGPALSSGITWTINNNALATVVANTASLKEVVGDQTVTFGATYNGKTSATPFAVLITDIVPVSVAVTSNKGATIKRGESATFSAEITLNNGTKTAPSAKYPVTWTNTNSGAGSFTTNAPVYQYIAAASNIDITFNVAATTTNAKSGMLTVTLDGFPIPVSATIEGFSEVAANSSTDYTTKVVMSDTTIREISATKTAYSAVWATTLDFVGTGGSFGVNGRLVAGAKNVDRLGKVSSVYTDTVSGLFVPAEKNIKILATLPVPQTASLTGPQTLIAGEIAEYSLEVTLTDGTVETINSSSIPTAAWTMTNLTGNLVNGKYTAPSLGTASNGSITAVYTKNGQQISRTITVQVASTIVTTTPPPGAWQDAVYVGEIPHNYGEILLNNNAETVTKMTNLLQYQNSFDGNNNMIRLAATGTKSFTAQTINLDYWNDASGAVSNTGTAKNITERAIILYPKKYGKSFFEAVGGIGWSDYFFMDGIDAVPAIKLIKTEDANSDALNPNGDPLTISLPINGVPTDFYVYLAGSSMGGPNAGTPKLILEVRTK